MSDSNKCVCVCVWLCILSLSSLQNTRDFVVYLVITAD